MVMKAGKNCVDIGILVSDIEKALGFYRDLLGLEKIQEMPVPFGTMHRMAFGDSFVKLIDPTKVPPAGVDGLTKSLGFRYLTFQVSNIDEICAACEEAGVEFVELPVAYDGLTIAVNPENGEIIAAVPVHEVETCPAIEFVISSSTQHAIQAGVFQNTVVVGVVSMQLSLVVDEHAELSAQGGIA